jgi:pimeloyl-ACP methyl ester carboxylesterase
VESLVARWAPPPSDFIEVKGQLVHLRDEGPRGDPTPIVLLHGTSASLHTWEGWAHTLKAQRRVISLRPAGLRPDRPLRRPLHRPTTTAATPTHASSSTCWTTLKLPRVVLGGNSLGGEIAWRVATLAPERVDRLVLVDASGTDFTPESVPLGFVLARLPVLRWISEYVLPRELVAQGVANVYGDPSRVTHGAGRPLLRADAARRQPPRAGPAPAAAGARAGRGAPGRHPAADADPVGAARPADPTRHRAGLRAPDCRQPGGGAGRAGACAAGRRPGAHGGRSAALPGNLGMTYLILGLVVFLGVHSVRIVADGWRTTHGGTCGGGRLQGRVLAWLSLAGFALMVLGFWPGARARLWCCGCPPTGLRHAAALLTLMCVRAAGGGLRAAQRDQVRGCTTRWCWA